MHWKNTRPFLFGCAPLLAGLALTWAVLILVVFPRVQTVSLLDASMLPLGHWSDNKTIFRYDNSASEEITIRQAEDGQGRYIHTRFVGPSDNGLGCMLNVSAPYAASLRITWRIRGKVISDN